VCFLKFKLVYIIGLNVIFFAGNALWSFHNNNSQDADIVIDAFSRASPREGMLNKNAIVKATASTPAVESINQAEKEKKEVVTAPSIDVKAQQKLRDNLESQLISFNQTNIDLMTELNRFRRELMQKNLEINALKEENKTLKLAKSSSIASDVELVKADIESEPDLIKFKTDKTVVEESHTIIGKDVAQPQYGQEKPLSNYTGSIEFGFSYSQNSIETRAADGRFILNYEAADLFEITSNVNFGIREEDSYMTAKNFRWQLQGDKYLDPRNFIYARTDLRRTEFASYDKEDSYTVGYGRIVLAGEKNELNVEVGPGYRMALPNVDTGAVSVDELILRLGIYDKHVLSESLQLSLDSELELGKENSTYSASFKLQNKIYRELFLISESNYKYTQNVPDGTSNKDISTNLKLKYAF